MYAKMIFYIFILMVLSCSQLTNNQAAQWENPHVKGEVLKMELANFKPHYHGHPPAISTILTLTNNSETPYLLCGMEGIIVLRHKEFKDTFAFFNKIVVKPNSTDTIYYNFPILKNREEILASNYTNADLIYQSTINCNPDSSLNSLLKQYNYEGIALDSIKPIDYVLFKSYE